MCAQCKNKTDLMCPLKQVLKLTFTKSPPWIMKSFITLHIKSVKKKGKKKLIRIKINWVLSTELTM